MRSRLAKISFIIENLETNMRVAGRPAKAISKEKMRFRERLDRLSDYELTTLCRLAEIDAKRRDEKSASTY